MKPGSRKFSGAECFHLARSEWRRPADRRVVLPIVMAELMCSSHHCAGDRQKSVLQPVGLGETNEDNDATGANQLSHPAKTVQSVDVVQHRTRGHEIE